MSTATPKPPPDADAREQIRAVLDTTLFVEAAAGTGKTTELVARLVALLRHGKATLDQIVAVTFTEKAAGEMKLRVRTEIEKARAHPETTELERTRFVDALGKLELARIGTIHAFCADLLHERPVESRVDPLFEVANEEGQVRLVDRVFDAWFERTLADPPEGIRRVLRRRVRGPNASGPRDHLRRAVDVLLEHRDFSARWRREPFERDVEIDHLLALMREIGTLADRAARSDDYLARSLTEIARFGAEVRHREAVRARDYDGLEAELRGVTRWRSWRWTGGRGRVYGPGLERAEVLTRRDALKQALDAFVERADADLAPLLQTELGPVIEAYQEAKRRAGMLDFLDLLVRARDLLRDDTDVRADLQSRFTHYFVDEFQDTDPLQAEILLLLASGDPAEKDWRRAVPSPGRLFLVGDPKQSIYRFRRADVAIYEEVKQRLAANGAQVVQLAASFRSVPSIQAAVNAAFAPRMTGPGDGSQAAYVPLEPVRADASAQPAIVVLPVPRPYKDWGNRAQISNWEIERSLPDAVGAFVHWLVTQSGWTVAERERPDVRVPVAPRHVCLLFRRFQSFRDDVTRPYVRALEQRRIAHVLVGGRSFHEREEVLALRNALVAIEWPDDDLRVFATLRGPLFALADDSLLAFRHAHKSLHPLRHFEIESLPETEQEVARALAVLAELHRQRNRRPLAQTVAKLLADLRAHAGIAIWPTGEQALANCLRSVDLARRFERRGAASFRAFVEWLEEQAESGTAAEAPAVEEGTEGVRIMTVHRAKGLEFPVVILCDPTCKASRDTPSRHVDPARGLAAEAIAGCAPRELIEARELEVRHDREEGVRIAYVAATRARDLLVVPGIGDPRGDDDEANGWLDVLRPAVEPAPDARRNAEPAPGCPPFGKDSVLERPDSVRAGTGGSIAPGLHRPQRGEHRMVWWDPHALVLDVEPTVGLRQQRILEADAGELAAQQGVRAHAAWQQARDAARVAGAQASIDPRPVTALAAEGSPPADVAVETLVVEASRGVRPGGRRFGVLVHAIFAALDFADARESAVRALAKQQGRIVGATEAETDAAGEAVVAALASPILRRAAGALEVRRETPVWLRRVDGTLAEGVIDLAFREAAGWVVVDFKTDRELADRHAVYVAQVALYAEAVSAATGVAARGVLLQV